MPIEIKDLIKDRKLRRKNTTRPIFAVLGTEQKFDFGKGNGGIQDAVHLVRVDSGGGSVHPIKEIDKDFEIIQEEAPAVAAGAAPKV